MVTGCLETKSAVINELQVNKPIVTSWEVIACCLRRKNTDHDLPLEEGDVMYFFAIEHHVKSHIERLTHFNASEAMMAGVISRLFKVQSPAEDEGEGKKITCLCFPILL